MPGPVQRWPPTRPGLQQLNSRCPPPAHPLQHFPAGTRLMASVGVAASLPLARSVSLPLHLPRWVSFSNHFDDVKSGFYSWPKRGKVLGLKSKRMLGRIVRRSCALFGVTCGEQRSSSSSSPGCLWSSVHWPWQR